MPLVGCAAARARVRAQVLRLARAPKHVTSSYRGTGLQSPPCTLYMRLRRHTRSHRVTEHEPV